MAIARDIGNDIGVSVTTKEQASIVISAILELDDDGDDEDCRTFATTR